MKSVDKAAHLQQLTQLLMGLGSPLRSAAAQADKNSGLKFLAIRVPVLKQVATRDFSLSQLSAAERLAVWDHVWKQSPYYEVMAVPLYHYRSQGLRIDPASFAVIRTWIERVENWGHCDELGYILSCFTELDPDLLLPYLHDLNRGGKLWKIRASIVATVHYSGKNAAFLPPGKVFPLLEPHVGNKNKYVSKAIKWVLREMKEKYPRDVRHFATAHGEELGRAFLRSVDSSEKTA